MWCRRSESRSDWVDPFERLETWVRAYPGRLLAVRDHRVFFPIICPSLLIELLSRPDTC